MRRKHSSSDALAFQAGELGSQPGRRSNLDQLRLDGVDPSVDPERGHLRFDFAPMSRIEPTPQGFLRIEATLGRVGVVKYELPGGGVRRELRPPDEVFRADSVSTLAGAVATDKHPPRPEAWITSKNWKKWAVGFVGDDVRQDGSLLRGRVTVQDAEMIAMIQDGRRREISPGYLCLKMDETAGRFNGRDYGPHVTDGEPYDCVQRDIVYNSIGIGPRGWGRQGSDVALRLDSADKLSAMLRMDGTQIGDFIRAKMTELNKTVIDLAQETGIIAPAWPEDSPLLRSGPVQDRTWVLCNILDGWTERPSNEQLKALGSALDVDLESLIRLLPEELRNLDGREPPPPPKERKRKMDTITMNLDGVEVEVAKPTAQLIERFVAGQKTKVAGLEKQVADLTTERSGLQARLDGTTEKVTKLETELAAAPEKARAAVKQRLELEGKVRRVMGKDGEKLSLDGKNDRQLQMLALEQLSPGLNLDGRDDTYVGIRFDIAMEGFKEPDASAIGRGAVTGGRRPEIRQDGGDDEPDPEAARAKMAERNQKAWEQAKN